MSKATSRARTAAATIREITNLPFRSGRSRYDAAAFSLHDPAYCDGLPHSCPNSAPFQLAGQQQGNKWNNFLAETRMDWCVNTSNPPHARGSLVVIHNMLGRGLG